MDLEIILKVEWKWPILPAGMIVLSCLFLGLVAAESFLGRVDVWKNNILAVVFHGLSADIRNESKTGEVMNMRLLRGRQEVSRLVW